MVCNFTCQEINHSLLHVLVCVLILPFTQVFYLAPFYATVNSRSVYITCTETAQLHLDIQLI